MLGTSYIYSRAALLSLVTLDIQKKMIEEVSTKEPRTNILKEYINILSNKHNLATMIQYWCDHISEEFFQKNKFVDDVLVETETAKIYDESRLPVAPVLKEWMASR